jgi:hypothetical protein
MKLEQKLEYLQNNYMSEWLKKRREVEDIISEGNSMFCVCGRLATGLHEMGCRKFQNKVTAETIKKLKHLIPKQEKQNVN